MEIDDYILNGGTIIVKCKHYINITCEDGCATYFDCKKIFKGCKGIHYISWTDYIINRHHLIEVKGEG